MKTVKLGNIFGYTGGNFSGNVYDKYSLSLSYAQYHARR